MTKYSLRVRMMLLILVPTLLIGVLLTTFFVFHRYNQMQKQVISFGSGIIEPIVVISKIDPHFNNPDNLQKTIAQLQQQHAKIVQNIAIFDQYDRLITASNILHNFIPLIEPQRTKSFATHSVTQFNDSLIIRMPMQEHVTTYTPNSSILELPQQQPAYIAIELDLHLLHLQQNKEAFIAILLLVICLSIAILSAYQLTQDITLPLHKMVTALSLLRLGELDSRVEGEMFGEFDTLKNQINLVAAMVRQSHKNSQKTISLATEKLRHQVEKMEQQTVTLNLAKDRAAEASRIKSEFLANMSHELRTPLNGVIGFTRQLLKTALTPTQIDYLTTIDHSANNLLNIINDSLDFSKLEAGKLQLEHIPFSLQEILNEVIVLLIHSVYEKEIEFTLKISRNVPEYLVGDPLRLQQVITNLLGNAVKFTEHGNIDVIVELRSRTLKKVELEIQVRDTGTGILERQQSKLFEAFRQANASIPRLHGGSGLGLAIAQRLVQEMGGGINFHSRPNHGSTFWFTINVDVDDHPAPSPYDISSLSGKNFAYIESNAAATEATLEILNPMPLHVVHVSHPQQLSQTTYDALLIGLPVTAPLDINYYRETISALTPLSDTILVALPSHLLLDSELFKSLGATACLSKPVMRNQLLAALFHQSDSPTINASISIPDATPALLPITVMAVDDNPANLKLIGMLLNEQVTHTLLCDSAKEALEIARKTPLDIVLMDIQMPDINGIQATDLLRQLPLHLHTPVIAVTANTAVGYRETLLKAGMDGYLTKPIDERQLLTLLQQFSPISSTTQADFSSAPTENIVSNKVTFDWDLAVRQAANKEQLALDLLNMLLEFLPEVSSRIEKIVQGAEDEQILELIHKLHGSCGYCGVPRLKNACNQLETALRSGATLQELEPEWFELLDEIENVKLAVEQQLNPPADA